MKACIRVARYRSRTDQKEIRSSLRNVTQSSLLESIFVEKIHDKPGVSKYDHVPAK